MSLFSERLKEIMEQRGINQSQLCAMTDIPKSAMTQYLSARFEPKRGRLDTICRALNISQTWLIGFSDHKAPYGSAPMELNADEQRLIMAYRDDPALRSRINELLGSGSGVMIFRAAKSNGGKSAPESKLISEERLKRLVEAPESDDDI